MCWCDGQWGENRIRVKNVSCIKLFFGIKVRLLVSWQKLCLVELVLRIQYLSCPQPKGLLLERRVWVQFVCAIVRPASQFNTPSNELQLTFCSCNICWALTAVTSLSSLHSLPPTVSSVLPPPQPTALGFQLRAACLCWFAGSSSYSKTDCKQCWLGVRNKLASC